MFCMWCSSRIGWMVMKSKVYIEDFVENKDRKFGSNLGWYAAEIIGKKGEKIPAFFTEADIRDAVIRAQKNPEDVPEKSFFQNLFGL